jgi:hypothetical protein
LFSFYFLQTRAWHPVFQTAGSAPNAAMIHGLFSQKNLKITIDQGRVEILLAK